MARAKVLGKTILLLILIIVLILFGILWFDMLGIIQAKHTFAPIYKLFGLQVQTSTAPSSPNDLAEADLDNDRWAKRIESLDIRTEELDKREEDILTAENNNAQIAQELEDQKKMQDEREKTFNNEQQKYDDKIRNIDQIVQNLEGMQPTNAVNILVGMDDQLVIDVLRRADERALAANSSSMVAYWLSLMPSDRAAEVQRKMVNKPTSLD